MTAHPIAPETALQRERRLFRELSSRLLDSVMSKIFDLRPEKAGRRMTYFILLFLFSGFVISLYYFSSDWGKQISSIFNALIGRGDLNASMTNFASFLLDILRDPRVLQYLPVFIAPFFIALQSAAIYLADIFELEDVGVARRFISGVALTGSNETIRIKNGEVVDEDKETPLFLIGGPGKVIVELDSVALFERADGSPQVIGPTGNEPDGKATLEGFERFRQALDLRNHHVDLRDQDAKSKAVQSRSRDGIPVKATDVRLLFSIYRGDKAEPSPEMPYPFSKEAVEQIVYKAASRVTPELIHPSKFEFSWIPKMIGLIRGRLSGFMSEHNLTEYLASTGMPEFEKAKQREDKIVEHMQQLAHSSDDVGRKEVKPPPNFQPRYKVKNLFAQFADDFTHQARNSGVELHWIGVGTWNTPVEVVPEKHLEAWKLTQENLKSEGPVEMGKIEQKEVVEKMKELIRKVPLYAFDELYDASKQGKKFGKQTPKRKDLRKFGHDNDGDHIISDDERDQIVEMLSILQDMQEERPREIQPKDTDHAHDVQALLLEYRKQFVETIDFIKSKKEQPPQNIVDAIKHIDNQIGHWAGRP